MILQKELAANPVFAPADLSQNPYAVYPRESRDGQKAAKTGPQSKAGAQQEPI
jgi:hypothetical protein